MQPVPIHKNFLWLLLSNFTYAIYQWTILILLARVLDVEIVGQYVLALAITTPVIMFANLGLRPILATDVKEQHSLSTYSSLRVSMAILAIFVVICLCFFLNYKTQTEYIILTILFIKIFECFSDLAYGFFQRREQMDQIAKSVVLRSSFSIAVFSLVLVYTHNVIFALSGVLVVTLVTFSCYDFRCLLKLHSLSANSPKLLTSDTTPIIQLFKLALPTGIAMMLVSLNGNMPRYIIRYHLGDGSLAIFATIFYFTTVGNMIINAIGQAAAPRLANHYANKRIYALDRLMLKLFTLALLIGIAGVIVSLLFGKMILYIIYGEKYAQYQLFLHWSMVAIIPLYISSLLGYTITAMRNFIVPPYIIACSSVIFIIIGNFLVAKGILGIIWTILIAYTAQAIMMVGLVLYLRSQQIRDSNYKA